MLFVVFNSKKKIILLTFLKYDNKVCTKKWWQMNTLFPKNSKTQTCTPNSSAQVSFSKEFTEEMQDVGILTALQTPDIVTNAAGKSCAQRNYIHVRKKRCVQTTQRISQVLILLRECCSSIQLWCSLGFAVWTSLIHFVSLVYFICLFHLFLFWICKVIY